MVPKLEVITPIKRLHVLVGLPYSGKSSYAAHLKEDEGYVIVSPDAIRLALHGERFNLHTEEIVWAIATYMVKSLFIAGHDDVILDACNMTKKRRKDWQGRRLGWETLFHVIDTDAEVCKERAFKHDDEDIIPIIDRMDGAKEQPQPFEIYRRIKCVNDTFIVHNNLEYIPMGPGQ
jgi:predicted kinase